VTQTLSEAAGKGRKYTAAPTRYGLASPDHPGLMIGLPGAVDRERLMSGPPRIVRV
jgi:hypothetical protein